MMDDANCPLVEYEMIAGGWVPQVTCVFMSSGRECTLSVESLGHESKDSMIYRCDLRSALQRHFCICRGQDRRCVALKLGPRYIERANPSKAQVLRAD
jgi:hypothetical protein